MPMGAKGATGQACCLQEEGNDTLPLLLEPIAEALKEGKVAQDMNKEAQEMSEDPIAETHSDKEDARPKRVTKKPAYLKDYV